MSHLRIPHITIGWQANCRSVGFQGNHQLFLEKYIQKWCIGTINTIPFIAGTDPHAIHNDHYYGAGE
jgi:hypothetical protein